MRLALAPILMLPCLIALLVSIKRESLLGRRISKPLCSLTFLLGALLATPPSGEHAWAYAGLGLSFLGDMFLLGEDRKALATGLVAFLAGHVCYLVWILPQAGITSLPLWTPLLVLPFLAAGAWILRAAWDSLGSLRIPGILYFCALSFLAWTALASWLGHHPTSPSWALKGLGLALFFVSDLAVARHRLVKAEFGNKVWGLPTYYLAQHALALSLAQSTLG